MAIITRRGLVLNEKDNVANMLEDVQAGETVEFPMGSTVSRIEATESIPFGFKMAIAEIGAGEPIIKYGAVIGIAVGPILPGRRVHVHNLAGARGRGDLAAAKIQGGIPA